AVLDEGGRQRQLDAAGIHARDHDPGAPRLLGPPEHDRSPFDSVLARAPRDAVRQGTHAGPLRRRGPHPPEGDPAAAVPHRQPAGGVVHRAGMRGGERARDGGGGPEEKRGAERAAHVGYLFLLQPALWSWLIESAMAIVV